MNADDTISTKVSKFSLLGWIVIPLAAVFPLRLIYEELYLSIKQGPQLILYSFGHTSAWVIPIGLAMYAAIAYLPLAVIRILWRKYKGLRIPLAEVFQLTLIGLIVLPVFLPLATWIRMRVAIAGINYNTTKTIE